MFQFSNFKPVKESQPDIDRIGQTSSQFNASATNLAYYPFGVLSVPDGIDLTLTAYPTTASKKPIALNGWQTWATGANQSALLLRGYRGKLRIQLTVTKRDAFTSNYDYTVAWVPVNAVAERYGTLEYKARVPRGVAVDN